jgi:hypothetical protein
MQVQRVDIAHVNQVWNLVEPFIANAMEHSCGDYTAEQIKTLVVMGHWTLLVAVEEGSIKGAATVSFSNRPNDRVAFITAIGGKLISSPETFEQLKVLLGSVGATYIEGARESLLPAYGQGTALKRSTEL